jgi:4-amino-4-deoxy-L-arabinose transferase-like glycosyltransferase
LGFGVYYAWEQSRGVTDASFRHVMFGRDYLMIGADHFLPGDAAAYNLMAVTLLETGTFRDYKGNYSANTSCGLPIFLAGIYGLFGYKLFNVIPFNALLATLSLYFIYLTCHVIFGRRIAIIACILQSLNIRFLYHVGSINYYPLLIFLTIFSFYLTFKLSNNDASIASYLLLGCIFGYTALVGQIFAPVALLLIIYLIIRKRKVRHVLAAFLIMVSIITLWIGRNYIRIGSATHYMRSPLAFQEGNNDSYKRISLKELYYLPGITENQEQKELLSVLSQLKSKRLPESEIVYEISEINKLWLRNNKLTYLKNIVWRIKGILSPFTRDMSFRNKFFATILWGIIIVPGLVGLFYIRDKQLKWFFVVCSLLLIISPSFIVLDRYLHYQVPLQGILTIPASLVYFKIYEYLKGIHFIRLSNPKY